MRIPRMIGWGEPRRKGPAAATRSDRARARHARRSIGAVALATIIVLAIGAATPARVGPTRRAMYSARLPNGTGRPIAERACLICHSAMLITQQHKDSTGWEKTVKQMEAWGAPVPPAEHAALIGYLRTRLGVTPAK